MLTIEQVHAVLLANEQDAFEYGLEDDTIVHLYGDEPATKPDSISQAAMDYIVSEALQMWLADEDHPDGQMAVRRAVEHAIEHALEEGIVIPGRLLTAQEVGMDASEGFGYWPGEDSK
jgi:hypothetical protein